MYRMIYPYILLLLSLPSFSKTIEIEKGRSFSLAYDFHYVESINANSKMFQNRRIIKKTFSIPHSSSSTKNIAFIPFNILKPGRYEFQGQIKPNQKLFSLVKYYLVAISNDKIKSRIKDLKDAILLSKAEASLFVKHNDLKHHGSEYYDDDCVSSIFPNKILKCRKSYMNQYQNVNFGLFNDVKITTNVDHNNSQYVGLFIEFDKPINEYNIQNSILYEDEGQSNVMGNSKYPNFVDHIPLGYAKEKSLDSFVGIKSTGNSSYVFKIKFNENDDNYLSYKLARLSSLTSQENTIAPFNFKVTVSCDDNIKINKDTHFNQENVKHFDSIFF